jgi:hypothetical protein
MIELSKLCYPTEPITQTLDRVVGSLYPSIRTIVAASKYNKIEELVKACQNATNNVLANSRVNKLDTKVPWMTKRPEKDNKSHNNKSHDNENNNHKKYQNEYNKNKQNNNNQANRGYVRGNYRGSYRGNHQNSFQSRTFTNTQANQTQYESGNKNQNNNKNDRGSNRGNYYGGSNRGRDSFRGNNQPIQNPPSKPIQCRRCFGLGHKERECGSQYGFALGVTDEEGTYLPLPITQEEYDPDGEYIS